jgi:hypothetical protein
LQVLRERRVVETAAQQHEQHGGGGSGDAPGDESNRLHA